MRPIRLLLLTALLGTLPGCGLIPSPPPSPITLELVGQFHVLWGDGPPGSETTEREYWLIDDEERWHRLLLEEKLLDPWGGPIALQGKRVHIRGETAEPSASIVRVLALQPEKSGSPGK